METRTHTSTHVYVNVALRCLLSSYMHTLHSNKDAVVTCRVLRSS